MTCPICLLDDASFKTSCHHSYHRECLRQWARENPTCPVCRAPFTIADLSHLTRSSLRASRCISENYVRQLFRNVGAMFVYVNNREPTVFGATWIFHTRGVISWMSSAWAEHYRAARGHTLEAFQLSNDTGVPTVVHSFCGVPPARLFYCRICRQAVFSHYRFLSAHFAHEHAPIN